MMIDILINVETVKDVERTMVLEVDQINPLTLGNSYQMSRPKY